MDVLPSLSRLKDKGIGKNKTREDHATSTTSSTPRMHAARKYGAVRHGRSGPSDEDRKYMKFANAEARYISQDYYENRTVKQTSTSAGSC